jgi:hypothetical protein
MSSYRTRTTAANVVALPGRQAATEPSPTMATATYAADMLKGLRQLTRVGRKDLAFLDYLIAMAEEEAACLATNVYH